MTKEKQGLWPGQICLTRSGTSPGSGLICLTKYALSKILDLKDLDFFQPWGRASGLNADTREKTGLNKNTDLPTKFI